jgi:cytochrome c-type protein NapB
MRRIRTVVMAMALCGISSVAGSQSAPAAADAARLAVTPDPEEADVPVFEYGDKRPGQSQRLAREWDGAPALIPHAITGLTPITATRNACAGCHGRAGATTGPPPAPASHFVDTSAAPPGSRPQVAGARWNCTACHVPQTNAPALR